MVNAEVAPGGELSCEGQVVGRLQGFRFTPETAPGAQPASIEAADIAGLIVREFDARANRFSEAVDASLVLANDGAIRWLGDPIAKMVNGDHLLAPRAVLLADDNLSEEARQKAQARVDLWLGAYVKRLLGPLLELEAAVGLEGAARNVALQVAQALGVLERGRIARDVKALDQDARGILRKMGVRFGAYYIYLPLLVKPAIRALATQLWTLRPGGSAAGRDELPQFAASGRTSFLADTTIPRETYRVAGFRLCEDRAVRVDIVERLADLIRPAVAFRSGVGVAHPPPPGSADGDGFVVTGAMTSLAGCSGESFAAVLRSLGFVSERVKGPALTPVPPVAALAGGDASPVPADLPAPAGAADGGGEPTPIEVSDGGAAAADAASAVSQAPAASDPVETVADEAPPAGESADAVADEAPSAAAASPASDRGEAAAAASEPLIEVWRPRPAARQRNQRHGVGKDRARSRPAPEGETHGGRREAATEKFARRRRASFQGPPQASAEASPRPQEEARGFRGERAPRERPDAKGTGEAGQGRRTNKGGAAPQRGLERPAAPPSRREPPVNMDSPFAKLLALKSQLEAKGKGG